MSRIRDLTDPRVGLVLLDATPLQPLPHGYDDFDDEVRELPWNSPGEDQEALMRHFSGWGMQRLPDSRSVQAWKILPQYQPRRKWLHLASTSSVAPDI